MHAPRNVTTRSTYMGRERTKDMAIARGAPLGLWETRTRERRWRIFQVTFFFLYLGVVLDLLTTSMGYQRIGSAYEQNPLGALLIQHLGWTGLLATFAGLAAICYV